MKNIYPSVKQICLILVCFLYAGNLFAQTAPAAQALPYTQNFSGLAHTSTTYPVGWQGWSLGTASSGAFRTTAPLVAGDLALNASSGASTAAGGIHNYNGKIGMLASGSVDPSICLAISTTGLNNVLVNFDAMTIRNPYDGGSNTRINGFDLQYRVGVITNGWLSVSGLANGVYQNNTLLQTGSGVTTPQNSQPKSLTLPAACNNQAIVYLRWVQRDISGAGSRASFAVDNISICATSVTPTIAITGPTTFCSGQNKEYNATITNGGTTPVYAWKKNGGAVGTNSPLLLISGLVATDQISCILTSNATCITSTTATSNTITIATVASPPAITSGIITHSSCPGVANGAINITVSGGTAPYTICWDTVNILNGATFAVTFGAKTSAHPYFGVGSGFGYLIDGVEGKALTLTRGINYGFSVSTTASHPFFVSTAVAGATLTTLVNSGQTGAPTGTGTVNFTPNASHPSLLYYACQFHLNMGYNLNIQNGWCVEDPTNLKGGTYTVIVTDANGCTATAQYTVNELPSPVSVGSIVTDASCGNGGSIDLTPSGGTAPYTVCWDTVNIANGPMFAVTSGIATPANPNYPLAGLSFIIDGIETKELYLTKGITYDFNVFAPGHPWHISTDPIGGNSTNLVTNGQSGAPEDNGLVTFIPNNAHPSLLYYDCAVHQYMGYNVNISSGYCVEDITDLAAGTYSVMVTDASGCTAIEQYIIENDDDVTDPSITCPDTANISTDASLCTSSASIGNPLASDNCSLASVDADPAGPYSVGTHTITWTATDASSNTATCTQIVNVIDGEDPVITCNGTVNIGNDPGLCTGTTSLTTPGATDNCSVLSVVSDHPSTTYAEGPTTVTWTATDVNGRTAQCTQDVVVTVNHAAAPTSVTSDDPNDEICSGQNVLLTANGATLGTAGGSYQWYEGSCGTGSSLGSASTLNVLTPSVGSHTYYVRIEEACGNTSCSSITILVTSGPPGAITGNLTGPSFACSGTVALVTVDPISGSNINYSWNIGTNSSVVLFSTNIGGPFSAGPFSTPTNQVYAQFGTLGASYSGYNVCVQGVNDCGSTANKCVWIRGKVSGPGLIAPADPIACPNNVKNYTCGASAGATVYNWTLGGSATPITSGQGSTAVTVTFPPAFTSGQLCVTAALACGGSSASPPRCMNISNTPANPGAIAGPTKVCPGATGVAFSVPLVTGATSYNWTVPSGATIATGTGTNAITVNFPTPYSGAPSICVTATGACATSAPRCRTVGTNIPAVPGNIIGPNSNNCNSTVQYSIPNVAGATSYTWTNPAGTTINSGQGTTTILLSVGPTFTTGALSVTANTSLCTPGSSAPRTITIIAKPSTPGTITASPLTWCAGGFVNFSVTAASPLPTYTWFVANGTISAGQGSNNIDVTWGSGAGNVNVTASNGCGSSGTRSQSFSSSCREEELSASDNFAVYPNPAHDNVTVSIYVKEAMHFNISLRDLSGRIILSEDRNGSAGLNTYDMELKNFAKGLYTLEVQSADKSWRSKVVIE